MNIFPTSWKCFSDLLQIETALPQIKSVLPEIATTLAQIEIVSKIVAG